MYKIWFCEIWNIDKDNYLSLSYEKLIYSEIEKEDVIHHCTGLEEEWGDNFVFDRIDHDVYVRFKNNDKYCLFLEEMLEGDDDE